MRKLELQVLAKEGEVQQIKGLGLESDGLFRATWAKDDLFSQQRKVGVVA